MEARPQSLGGPNMSELFLALNAGFLVAQVRADRGPRRRAPPRGARPVPARDGRRRASLRRATGGWDRARGSPLVRERLPGPRGRLEGAPRLRAGRRRRGDARGSGAPGGPRRRGVRRAGAGRRRGARPPADVRPAGAAAPAAQPRPIRLLRELGPSCRRWRASTPRSTAPCRRWRSASRCPEELHAAGLRRYGFHGLSYEYVAAALRELDPAAARGGRS